MARPAANTLLEPNNRHLELCKLYSPDNQWMQSETYCSHWKEGYYRPADSSFHHKVSMHSCGTLPADAWERDCNKKSAKRLRQFLPLHLESLCWQKGFCYYTLPTVMGPGILD